MIWGILVALIGILTLMLLTAPLETLSWWSRRGPEQTRRSIEHRRQLSPVPGDTTDCYLVYFSGVGVADPSIIPEPELPLLANLTERFGDNLRIVTEIYPYAVENRGLLKGRRSAWWWRFLASRKGKRLGTLSALMSLRNVIQVLVSADKRYGPMLSAGVARTVWKGLLGAGYQPGSKTPVVFLGWSGGAQIAVGASWYLSAAGVPTYVLALGGVIADDPGIDRLQHLWQLIGTKDGVIPLAPIAFSGRRPWARDSSWQRGVADGRVTEHVLGPFKHFGRGSYLSRRKAADGRQYRQVTIETAGDLLLAEGLVREQNPE